MYATKLKFWESPMEPGKAPISFGKVPNCSGTASNVAQWTPKRVSLFRLVVGEATFRWPLGNYPWKIRKTVAIQNSKMVAQYLSKLWYSSRTPNNSKSEVVKRSEEYGGRGPNAKVLFPFVPLENRSRIWECDISQRKILRSIVRNRELLHHMHGGCGSEIPNFFFVTYEYEWKTTFRS